MNIDWKARVTNKSFWITFIPTMLLLVQAIAQVFGITLDFTLLSENLINVINIVFVVLALLGIVTDTSTPTFSDNK